MQPLYSEQEFANASSSDRLPCKCYKCHKPFLKKKHAIVQFLNGSKKKYKIKYCSQRCASSHAIRKHALVHQIVNCLQCSSLFKKETSHINRSPNHFCSKSCATIYNNTHKKHGTRRSKLEVWLEQQLPSLYPSLEFHFNRKDAINAELDIYIPSIKLAFELNGIFHYEPIYGPKKLAQIQNNDQRKYQTCIEHGIELCLIDVSKFKHFKEKGAMMFLDVIRNIIDQKQ